MCHLILPVADPIHDRWAQRRLLPPSQSSKPGESYIPTTRISAADIVLQSHGDQAVKPSMLLIPPAGAQAFSASPPSPFSALRPQRAHSSTDSKLPQHRSRTNLQSAPHTSSRHGQERYPLPSPPNHPPPLLLSFHSPLPLQYQANASPSSTAKSRTIAVRLISMALTGYYRTLRRPRAHRPLSMLKYDPVGTSA